MFIVLNLSLYDVGIAHLAVLLAAVVPQATVLLQILEEFFVLTTK